MVAASGRTQRERLGRVVEFGHAERGARSAPRHVSQILPDVLARYGITSEALEQSAVAGRRERPSRGRAPAEAFELAALELTDVGAATELAPLRATAACAAGCW